MIRHVKTRAVLLIVLLCFTHSHATIVTYFSPEDKIQTKLIETINTTKNKIYAAIYMLTEKNIANALIKAKKERNVHVEIIIDKISLESSYGKGQLLANNDIKIFVYNPPPSTYNAYFQTHAIMHHKFALFDNTVWTGSFNWTRAANSKNKENVIVISKNIPLFNSYLQHFKSLKAESLPCPKKIESKSFYTQSKILLRKLNTRIRKAKQLLIQLQKTIDNRTYC